MNRKELNKKTDYLNHVDEITPKKKYGQSLFRAFWVGGAICLLGQLIFEFATTFLKMADKQAYTIVSISLIFLTAALTSIGVFDKIGKYAGAGSFVPISGFANSITAPAMEFKTEGFILGVAAQMFSIVGPVLVYGISSSIFVGIVYLILNNFIGA